LKTKSFAQSRASCLDQCLFGFGTIWRLPEKILPWPVLLSQIASAFGLLERNRKLIGNLCKRLMSYECLCFQIRQISKEKLRKYEKFVASLVIMKILNQ